MKSFTLAATAAYLLLNPAEAAGLYTKGSAVLQVDGSNYDRLIAKSNHTSIVEFYAPWCGHCQSLKPAYEKAAKSLEGLAKVAAVNCDDEENKPLCGRFGIQGFPTLKIIRPGKKPGKPTVEDYQGPRSAKGITDAVVEKIPNHIKKVKDSELEAFLEKDNSTAKAILFTEKGTTSALLRALAIDFLGSINVAQIRSKEANAVETFGIAKFPQLILLPGGDKEGLVYDGDLRKEPMVKFLSQAASPNPDPAPAAEKPKKSKKAKAAKSETPEPEKPRDAEQEPIVPDDAPEEVQTPPKPVDTKAPTIPQIQAGADLQTACLSPKHGVCLLALLKHTPEGDDDTTQLLESLNGIAFKHSKRDGKIFPFYAVPGGEEQDTLRQQLGLKGSGENELIVTNGKRAWFKRYAGDGYGAIAVEAWIDTVRMGEGKKQKFPEGVVVEAAEPVKAAEPEPEPEAQPQEDEPVKVEVVEEIVEETAPRDEL